MGYYVRAFCTSETIPTIANVLGWLEKRGRRLELDKGMSAVDEDSIEWEQLALVYRRGKLPILAECNRDDGSPESLMQQEIGEFLDSIGRPGPSLAKQRVISHLKKTRYIIACQLPTSDIDDDGYDSNADFLNYFVENCGGMIQADGEGFYEGSKLIVRLK